MPSALRLLLAAWLGLSLAACGAEPVARAEAPRTLRETGLYADADSFAVAPGVLPFTPQYPLWSDGAAKRRWIRLPPGSAIDASDPDAWEFPVGTRLWKEFRFGRRVETRYIERASETDWLFATYAWPAEGGSADGTDAVRAPETVIAGAHEIRPGVQHDLPSRMDCAACHEGRRVPVLGFSALQLSRDRDPLAPHGEDPEPGSIDLEGLLRRGLLRSFDEATISVAPRIRASSPRERAALGYLHANCGSCHTRQGDLRDLGLELDASLLRPGAALGSLLGVPSRFRIAGEGASARVVPGDPARSVLIHRASSRNPSTQMPPLGTRIADEAALDLLGAWIRDDLAVPASGPVLSKE
jgi:hypothetical protein